MSAHELRRAVDFAEYAEAVGVPTSQVIALQQHPSGALLLLYTPEPIPDDDPDGVDTTAWAAGLGRDPDGIVRVIMAAEPTPFSVHDVCAALFSELPEDAA